MALFDDIHFNKHLGGMKTALDYEAFMVEFVGAIHALGFSEYFLAYGYAHKTIPYYITSIHDTNFAGEFATDYKIKKYALVDTCLDFVFSGNEKNIGFWWQLDEPLIEQGRFDYTFRNTAAYELLMRVQDLGLINAVTLSAPRDEFSIERFGFSLIGNPKLSRSEFWNHVKNIISPLEDLMTITYAYYPRYERTLQYSNVTPKQADIFSRMVKGHRIKDIAKDMNAKYDTTRKNYRRGKGNILLQQMWDIEETKNISHSYMIKILRAFGFPKELIVPPTKFILP